MAGYGGLSRVKDEPTYSTLKYTLDLLHQAETQLTTLRAQALLIDSTLHQTNGQGSRFTNLLDAVDLQDAVTLKQLKDARQQSAERSGGGGDVFGPTVAVDGNITLFDGTTGKRIKDSGSSIASLLAQGVVQAASVDFSELQFESMGSSPVQVVPAQGATTLIVPIKFAVKLVITDAYTNSPSFNLEYGGGLGVNLSGSITTNGTALGTKLGWEAGAVYQQNAGTQEDGRNRSVMLGLNGVDPTGVGAATGRVTVAYFVMTGV